MLKRVSHLVVLLLFASTADAADAPEFIRVSPRDPRYLETTAGKPYIPIGLNLIAPPWVKSNKPEDRLAALDEWLGKLSKNGGNYIRVWLSNDFYAVEHEKAGAYDIERAKRIDAMLAIARKHGIRVKMTFEHFRDLDPANPGKTWAMNTLHHTSRGGLAASMPEWVSSPEARAQFVRKLEFFSTRYRDEHAVYGWELWNEMNAIRAKSDYFSWTAAMLPELHRLFPKHLAMQSLGSFDTDGVRPSYRKLVTLPGNDVAQVHRYLDLGAKLEICHGPVDVLAADSVREILAANPARPVILAESGAVEPSHSGPFKLYAKDKNGIILHDVLFAPFFSGAAGPGQCWHWDKYVNDNDLWWQFGRFAAAVRDIDPAAEKFEPILLEHDALRIYLLKGRSTLLAWCRDKHSTWRTELADGRAPEKLKGITINLAPHLNAASAPKVRIYDPWTDQWSDGSLNNGAITLPAFERSIVIRIAK